MVDPTKRRTGKNAPQNRLSRHSFFHCPSTILPRAACSDLSSGECSLPRRGISYLQETVASKSDREDDIGNPDYAFTDAVEKRKPYFPNQKDVKDLIRDLGLTKSNAELLISSLKQ